MTDAHRLVLCEGKEDVAFLTHFFKQRNIQGFFVETTTQRQPTGNASFESRLKALAAASAMADYPFRFEDLQDVIVMTDNDDDPQRAFEAVRRQIRGAQYGDPNAPRTPVNVPDRPRIQVLMLPRDGEPGGLETLCLQAAFDKQPHLEDCIEKFIECAKAKTDGIKAAKMRLRCLLSASCEKEPNLALTYAWTERHQNLDLIPLNHSCFDPIADFFKNL